MENRFGVSAVRFGRICEVLREQERLGDGLRREIAETADELTGGHGDAVTAYLTTDVTWVACGLKWNVSKSTLYRGCMRLATGFPDRLLERALRELRG